MNTKPIISIDDVAPAFKMLARIASTRAIEGREISPNIGAMLAIYAQVLIDRLVGAESDPRMVELVAFTAAGEDEE